jgi:hypothetical protein
MSSFLLYHNSKDLGNLLRNFIKEGIISGLIITEHLFIILFFAKDINDFCYQLREFVPRYS